MVDEVLQDLAARHHALAAADESEVHFLGEDSLADPIAPIHVPVVDVLLRAPQLGERRMVGGVARAVAVAAALDNWKAGEPTANLKSLPDPVEFSEELRTSHKLVEYSILKTDGTDPDVVRYTVTLKLKDKRGKSSEREAVYSVALKSPVIVARDPYY